MPYYGHARIDLNAVGASADQDITSLDPIYPGVLVTDFRAINPDTQRPWRAVELTLGGANNRRDDLVVTGWAAATILLIQNVIANEFSGSWTSGDVDPVSGFFCARRLAN